MEYLTMRLFYQKFCYKEQKLKQFQNIIKLFKHNLIKLTTFIMNKELISKAIVSAINLISNELDVIEYEDLKNEFSMTLEELNIALNELEKQ